MAPLLEDPRYRQTWNQISQNAESATENAAAGIWTFQHQYINPCFASIGASLEQCTGHCFPDREERARRRERGRTRGRAELSFDFYDDWDQEHEGAGIGGLFGGWGNDELDRLLAGSGSHSGGSEGVDQAPRRKRGMSYGTRGARRKSLDPDPTVIPSTSALGFLGRLPFKIGGTLRYKPSAADLQEHPGAARAEYMIEEGEPLIDDEGSEEGRDCMHGHRRQRSSTASSGETSDSFRSRGDIFPSDGEDDAVPLSDEFAMVLERRMTGPGPDDRSSGRTKNSKGKRPAGSRTLSRTMSRNTQSSQSRPGLERNHTSSAASIPTVPNLSAPDMVQTPSLTDLQNEEERVRIEEDAEVERKRQAAAKLAVARGLHTEESGEGIVSEMKHDPEVVDDISESSEMDKNSPNHNIPPDPDTRRTPDITDAPCVDEFVPARLPHFN